MAGTSEGLEIWDLVNGIKTVGRPGGTVRMLKVDWNAMRIQLATDGYGISERTKAISRGSESPNS